MRRQRPGFDGQDRGHDSSDTDGSSFQLDADASGRSSGTRASYGSSSSDGGRNTEEWDYFNSMMMSATYSDNNIGNNNTSFESIQEEEDDDEFRMNEDGDCENDDAGVHRNRRQDFLQQSYQNINDSFRVASIASSKRSQQSPSNSSIDPSYSTSQGDNVEVYFEDDPHHQKTIRFASDTVFSHDCSRTSQLTGDSFSLSSSNLSLDIDPMGKDLYSDDSTTSSGGSSSCSSSSRDIDEGASVDSQIEEERKIVRGIMFAGIGAGLVSFVGWGVAKMINRTSHDTSGAEEAVNAVTHEATTDAALQHTLGEVAIQQGGEQTATMSAASASASTSTGTATTTSSGAAMNSSMASANSMSSNLAGGYIPPGTTGMTGPQ